MMQQVWRYLMMEFVSALLTHYEAMKKIVEIEKESVYDVVGMDQEDFHYMNLEHLM
jgi:hypothetical protein